MLSNHEGVAKKILSLDLPDKWDVIEKSVMKDLFSDVASGAYSASVPPESTYKPDDYIRAGRIWLSQENL